MAINPLLKGFTKTQAKNNALINGFKANKEKAENDKAANKKPEPKKPNTDKLLNVQTNNQNTQGLSERALAYLETLKEKFGDMNFIVTHGESHEGKAGGCPSKSFNCFIDADLLERMAACETTAEKYEGVIKEARVQMDDLKAQAESKGLGHLVSSFGIRLNEDGTWSFSAMLQDSIWDKIGGNKTDIKDKNIFSNSIEGLLEELEKVYAAKAERAAEAEKEAAKPEDVDFKA
jgi:hypothetical protein